MPKKNALALLEEFCRTKHELGLARLIVEAGFPDADVIVEGQDVDGGEPDQGVQVQVDLKNISQ